MPPNTTLWNADPHTIAKIRIVEEYLKAWLAILSRYNGRVVYIDGFSGPGEYSGGEKGSPIVALETILNHQRITNQCEFCFLFIEKDLSRYLHLVSLIQRYQLPQNIIVQCVQDEFNEKMNEILTDIETRNASLAPAFLFIDPFGVSGLPFATLQRFMRNPRCEVFVNFMFEYINRFAGTAEFHPHLDELFGTNLWRECLRENDPNSRRECFVNLYESQLNTICTYSWKFAMLDSRNRTKYFLYYGTNHVRGLEKMKDAMWKIAPVGGEYSFSDRDYPQITLFEDLFNEDHLKDLLINNYRQRRVMISDIEDYVVSRTPYKKAHTKKALRKLEEENSITITGRSRRMTFPDGCIINFL